jgi:quercetin dioxygenase-like cupin family protein
VFDKAKRDGYYSALPGIEQRTLAHGERTMMVEFRLSRNADLPRHSHPHEQTGCLVSGHIRLTVGGESHDVLPGDSWSVPGGVEHRAQAFEDSVAIEVFSPPREDYLPKG